MAQRKSPARLAKDRRVAHLRGLAAANASAGTPWPWDALIALEDGLVGRAVLPDSPDYTQARQESNPAFQAYPLLIIYCE
ncbi:hypothetical protein [Paracidovorax citrulli]